MVLWVILGAKIVLFCEKLKKQGKFCQKIRLIMCVFALPY
jgi:hypothetical protein